MAFRLFAAPTLAFAATGFYHHTTSRPLRCEAPTAQAGFGFPWGSYYRPKPMAPRPRNRSGYDPTVYRQISTGSFVGVALGLCVARFGKTLCLVIGAVMLIVEALARQGIDIIPAWKIKDVDLRGFMLKNTAFKVSFGTAFILASIYG